MRENPVFSRLLKKSVKGKTVEKTSDEYVEARTARVCRLTVKDGVITAERYEIIFSFVYSMLSKGEPQ
ncbi:MAG: hypothetical protein IJF61_05130 [Clostridia bacterium]|nr:hypothetical protein [Clostridia bacterium]